MVTLASGTKTINPFHMRKALLGRLFQQFSRQIRKMDDIPDVDIDTGKFKYILIKVEDLSQKTSKHIVRGYTWAPFHADILERVEPNILKNKLKCDCVGGGRIEHSPTKKTIHIYGYSQGYGQADHNIACELVKKEYPEYTVTWSNEGY